MDQYIDFIIDNKDRYIEKWKPIYDSVIKNVHVIWHEDLKNQLDTIVKREMANDLTKQFAIDYESAITILEEIRII